MLPQIIRSKHEVVLRARWQDFAVLPGNRPSMRNQSSLD